MKTKPVIVSPLSRSAIADTLGLLQRRASSEPVVASLDSRGTTVPRENEISDEVMMVRMLGLRTPLPVFRQISTFEIAEMF